MPDFWADRVRTALAGFGAEELGADGPRVVADVEPKDWHAAVRACRDEVGCDFFDWLSAVDEGPAEPAAEGGPPGPIRFRVVAHLWSVSERRGVLLRALLTEGAVGSVVDLYPGADWHERETHEMFGVDFPGHPDLQPLLLAPEFEGHPLRKDFVLASRVVKPWPGAKEPGEGQGRSTDREHRQEGTVRKRPPKRPPGVPEDWIEPAAEAARDGSPGTAAPAATEPTGDTAPASAPKAAPDASDPRLRRPDAS